MHNSWHKFHIQSQYIHVFKIYPIFLWKPLTLRLCMPANNIDVTSEYPVRAICQEMNSLFSRVVTRTIAYLLYDYLNTRMHIFSPIFFICLSNIYSIIFNLMIFFFYQSFHFSYWLFTCRSVKFFSECLIINELQQFESYTNFSAIHECI